MGKVKVYVKPFDDTGAYVDDYIDISDRVTRLGDISIGIENSDYEVGVNVNSNLRLSLRNDDGYFSDVTNLNSIFRTKRKDSKVKVTYNRRTHPLRCGFFKPGRERLPNEVTVFEGLLNDISSVSDIKDQMADFSVLGFESKLQEMEVPYSSIDATDDYADAIYACLNQAPFNTYVTVDIANITPDYDPGLDSKDWLENKTVREALRQLLQDTRSVLYIKDSTVYVVPRDATASVQKTFYGQASIDGIENIVGINNFRDGVNRIKNYWTFRDTTIKSTDATSVSTYGVQKTELYTQLLNTSPTTKISDMLSGYKDDFSNPKIELELVSKIDYTTLALNILDRVTVDYPTVYTPADGDATLPRYGLDIYGAVRYPYGRFDLTLSPNDYDFKILNIKYSLTKNLVTFKLREI